nr:MAG TPA: hypothetical protein [Crassvirales sp.]
MMLRLNSYSGDENHPHTEDFKLLDVPYSSTQLRGALIILPFASR